MAATFAKHRSWILQDRCELDVRVLDSLQAFPNSAWHVLDHEFVHGGHALWCEARAKTIACFLRNTDAWRHDA